MDVRRRLHARRRSPRARIRATRSYRIATRRSAALPARRASSARRACAAKRSCASATRCSQIEAAARQRQHAPAQARRGAVRRDHPRRGGTEAARATAIASARCSTRTKACPRPGRARSRSNAAPIAPTSIAALAPLADRATTLATTAERAFSRALSGSCHTPLAAYAEWEEGRLWLRGLLASRDGSDVLRGEREARSRRRRGRRRARDASSRTSSSRAARRASSPARPDGAPFAAAAAREPAAARRRRRDRHAAGAAGGGLRAASSPRSARRRSCSRDRDPAARRSCTRSRARMRALADYDIAIFVSANAVEYGVARSAPLAARR